MTISKKNMKWIPWLLILPVVLIRGFTTVYPILMTVKNSFFNISILAGINEFIGFKNYLKVFSDPKVLTSISFTAIFVVASMIFHVILGVILALILNMKFKGRRFLRTIVLIPWAMPAVVAGMAAKWAFNNDYGQDKNKDTTHDVVIKKVITGNQAVESDTFQLVVTVTGTAGEKYKVTLDNAEQNPLTSGEKATYTVTNNTEIHIYGLTEGDKVQAVEEANTQGYQATYTTGLSEGTLTISSDGSEATVTNTKNSTSPTGVILNYGPYILMIALAGSMAAFFFFKRNRKEA